MTLAVVGRQPGRAVEEKQEIVTSADRRGQGGAVNRAHWKVMVKPVELDGKTLG